MGAHSAWPSGDTYMTSMVPGNLRMIVSADSSVSESQLGAHQ